jgi:hypothetical protein
VISHGPKVFFLSLILACGASAQIDSPNFRYVAINFPGAVFTAPTGINNLDAIVGYYEVGTNCFGETTPTCRTHGFILPSECREICGGSRARVYAITGELFGQDPSCIYQPKRVKPATKPASKADAGVEPTPAQPNFAS